MSLVKRLLLFPLMLAALWITPAYGASGQAAPDKDALKAMLAEILRENPDLVFDVLRSHSDVLYDIAMQGHDVRVLKDFQVQWTQDLAVPKEVVLDKYPSRGPENAPVTIIAYSDFTCSYCQRAAITIEQVLATYGNKVRIVFKALPYDPEGAVSSQRAAEYFYAAYAENPAKAWQLYALLFSNQNALRTDGELFLQQSAQEVGLDPKALAKAGSAKAIQDMFAQNRAEATRYGLKGTPCFLVNNLVIAGAHPIEIYSAAVERALKEGGKK